MEKKFILFFNPKMRALRAAVVACAALTLASGAAIPAKCSGQTTFKADHCVCSEGVGVSLEPLAMDARQSPHLN